MANPNKTVGKFRQKVGFPPKPPKPVDPFFAWFFEQVQKHGRTFQSMEEAQEAFKNEPRS